MRGLNKVFLMGNLTRDPEVRYTIEKRAWAKFGLAVNYSYKDKSGEWQEGVDFINIVAWGPLAERCGKYLRRGSSAFVQGKIKVSSYEAKDGSGKRYSTDIMAEDVIFVGGRSDSGGGGDYGQRESNYRQRDDYKRKAASLDSLSMPGTRPLSDLLSGKSDAGPDDASGFGKSIYEKDFDKDYNFGEHEGGDAGEAPDGDEGAPDADVPF